MLRQTAIALIIIAGALSAGCGDHPTVPPTLQVSGAVVSLATPHGDDGGVVVTLNGPDLRTIEVASSSYVLYSLLVSAQEAHVIVIGDVVPGPLFTVTFAAPHD